MKITDFEDAIKYLDNCKSIFGLKGFYSMKLSDSLKHNKELLIIPDAVHTDLYDDLDIIPFDKIAEFYKENF